MIQYNTISNPLSTDEGFNSIVKQLEKDLLQDIHTKNENGYLKNLYQQDLSMLYSYHYIFDHIFYISIEFLVDEDGDLLGIYHLTNKKTDITYLIKKDKEASWTFDGIRSFLNRICQKANAIIDELEFNILEIYDVYNPENKYTPKRVSMNELDLELDEFITESIWEDEKENHELVPTAIQSALETNRYEGTIILKENKFEYKVTKY
jgi:hypothetical protein